MLYVHLALLCSNPEYPFKEYVLCPYCKHPFWASASKGKSGGHFPAYHCSKGHKYFRIKLSTFHTTIKKFLQSLDITPADLLRFKKVLLEEALDLEKHVVEDKIIYEERIIEIAREQQLIKTQIRASSSPTVIEMLNEDVEKLQAEKVQLMVNRDKKEDQEFELQTAINKANYLLEHLEELIFGASNPIQSAALFGILFTETPTYQDLIAGTPKLEPYVKLIKQRHLSNFRLAG